MTESLVQQFAAAHQHGYEGVSVRQQTRQELLCRVAWHQPLTAWLVSIGHGAAFWVVRDVRRAMQASRR